MYSIVEIAGQQFKAEAGSELIVHRLPGNPGDKVSFSNVLLSDDNGNVKIGAGGSVSATIVEHLRGDKVLVFKKKRRKGYRKLNGHRQDLTKIKIDKL